jgi:hypothetical protein
MDTAIKRAKPKRYVAQREYSSIEQITNRLLKCKHVTNSLPIVTGNKGWVSVPRQTGNFPSLMPDAPYFFAGNAGFHIGCTEAHLSEPIQDLLGFGVQFAFTDTETGLMDVGENCAKWIGVRRRGALPKGLICPVPDDACFYEYHWREIALSRELDAYHKHIVAYLPREQRCLMACQSTKDYAEIGAEPHGRAYENLCMAAGVEDLARQVWQVHVTQTNCITLLTDQFGIRELALLREGPRAGRSQRRSPILHWVAEHTRRQLRPDSLQADTVIERYLRGITEFTIEGYSFAITQPLKTITPYKAWSHAYMEKTENPQKFYGRRKVKQTKPKDKPQETKPAFYVAAWRAIRRWFE